MAEYSGDNLQSRRAFLKSVLPAVPLLSKPVREIVFFGSGKPLDEIKKPDAPITEVLSLAEIDTHFVAGPDDLVMKKNEYYELFGAYFRDRLIGDKLQILAQMSKKLGALGTFERMAYRSMVGPDRLQNLILFGRQPSVSQRIEDIHNPDIAAAISSMVDNPSMIAQVAYKAYQLENIFKAAVGDHPDRQVLVHFKKNQQECIAVSGLFIEPIDYVYRRQRDRYEPHDRQERYAVVDEIKTVLERTQDVYGVPSAVLEALSVVEGGGGVHTAGLTLNPRIQREYVDHDFTNPDIQLVGSHGELGPTQIMPDLLNKLKFADALVWGTDRPNNIHNLKTAYAVAAAKIYIDAIALREAEQYRYTSAYESKRLDTLNELYNIATENRVVSSSKTGLETLVRRYGALSEVDMPYILLAIGYYNAGGQKFARLGDRTYAEFVAAYYHASLPESVQTKRIGSSVRVQ